MLKEGKELAERKLDADFYSDLKDPEHFPSMRISGQSILASVLPERLQNGRDPVTFQGLNPSGPESTIGYTIPNLLIDHSMRNPPVPPGFWRGVNINQNAIYLECFMAWRANGLKIETPAVRP